MKRELKHIHITKNTHTQIHEVLPFPSIEMKIQLNFNFCCCIFFVLCVHSIMLLKRIFLICLILLCPQHYHIKNLSILKFFVVAFLLCQQHYFCCYFLLFLHLEVFAIVQYLSTSHNVFRVPAISTLSFKTINFFPLRFNIRMLLIFVVGLASSSSFFSFFQILDKYNLLLDLFFLF